MSTQLANILESVANIKRPGGVWLPVEKDLCDEGIVGYSVLAKASILTVLTFIPLDIEEARKLLLELK